MTHDDSTRDRIDHRTVTADGRSGISSRRSFMRAVASGAVLAAGAGAATQTTAQADGRTLPWLHREGNELRDPEGNRVVLHGVNVVDPKRGTPEWGHMPTEDAIDLATNADRGWNARIIRLPMQPQDIGDHGPGSVEPVAFDEEQLVSYCETYVDPIVEKCYEDGLYVMLDYHRHWPEGPDWDDPDVDEELRLFWDVVATRYADQPHCIFEVYNEPTTPYPGAGDPTTDVDVTDDESEDTWLYWRETAQPWVDDLRDNSQGQIILIGSPRWSQWTYWAPHHEFEGENLAYTAHIYAQENMRPLETYFGEPSEEVPVFMSEYGFLPEEGAPYLTGSADEEGEQFRELYEEYDTIHTQAWCFDHSWTPELLEQSYDGGDRTFSVRNEWGEWVQDFLEDRADQDLPEAPTGAGPALPDDGTGPSTPTGLEASDVDPDGFVLSWSSVSDADDYVVSLDGDDVTETSATSYEFTSLDAGATYVAGVQATNDDGTSSVASIEVATPGGVDDVCVEAGAQGGEQLDNDQWVCDVDGDGWHRDVDASGDVTSQDLSEFFANQHRDPWDSRDDLFDFNEDGTVGQPDVVDLFEYI